MNEEKLDISQSNKKLFKMMAIPMIITQIVMGVMGLGDRIIGAVFVGEETLSIVTMLFPILMLAIAFASMIISGLGVELNYLLGKKEKEKAYGIATFITMVMVCLSLVLVSVLLLLTSPVVDFAVRDISYRNTATVYYTYIVLSFLPLAIGYTLSTLIIADGNAKYNMFGQLLLSIGNIVINIVLVVVFKLDIVGLGIGTLTSAILFLLYNLSYFVFKFNATFRFKKMLADFKSFGRIVYNGLSEFLTVGAFGISMMGINYAIQEHLSKEFFTAYATLQIFVTIYVAVFHGGIFGIMPIISKAYGSNNASKISSITKYTMIRTLIISLVLYGVVLFSVKPAANLFIEESSTVDTIFRLYVTVGIAYLTGVIAIFASGYLTALKKPMHSLVVSAGKPILLIPVCVYIGVVLYGESGLFVGVLVSEILSLPIIFITVKMANKSVKQEMLELAQKEDINKEDLEIVATHKLVEAT